MAKRTNNDEQNTIQKRKDRATRTRPLYIYSSGVSLHCLDVHNILNCIKYDLVIEAMVLTQLLFRR